MSGGLPPPRPGQIPASQRPFGPGSRAGTSPVSQLALPSLIYGHAPTIPPGATATIAPESPSPVAGWALANQPGYEIAMSCLQSSGSSNNPFVQAQLTWYESDLPTAPIVDELTWYLPAGFPVAAPVYGHGFLRGQYQQLQVTNLDSSNPVMVDVRMFGVSRMYPRDDWRWTSAEAVPGFNRPIVGSANGSLILAGVTPTILGSGNHKYLLPLFAGKTRMRYNVSGLTTNQAELSIISTCALPGIAVYQSFLQNGDKDPQPEISLAREPMQLFLQNNASVTAAFIVTLTAEEY